MMKAGDFTGLGIAASERRLLSKLRDISSTLDGVPCSHSIGKQITCRMNEIRALDIAESRAIYRSDRILEQEDWYRRKSDSHQNQAEFWKLASLLLQFLGVAGGSLKAFQVIDVDLLGITAALSASAIAWLQTRDHGSLAEAYSITRRELAIIGEEIERVSDEQWPEAVEHAELAISREHTLWRARRISLD